MIHRLRFLQYAIAVFALIPGPTWAADSSNCMGKGPGVYLVDSDGNPTPLSPGLNHDLTPKTRSLLFVVGNDDGYAENVDHFRLSVIASKPPIQPLDNVRLSRSSIGSECPNGLHSFFDSIFGPPDYTEKISNFDSFRNPANRGQSPELGNWHFKWNNALVGKKQQCEYTADHVPFVRDSNPSEHASLLASISQLSSTAYADAGAVHVQLDPRLVDLRLILVHRKIGEINCVKSVLGGAAALINNKVIIEKLRLGGKGNFLSEDRTVVDWKN